jgi:YD repeat-containing protein
VYGYGYDPRDRITQVTKTPVGGTATTEQYVHDANDNLISSTIDGITTTSTYDRNRLQTTSTGAVSTASNYAPFGRLDTLTVAGEVVQRYRYDGFDRIAEQQSLGTETSTTQTSYDPLDRTTERTEHAGTAEAQTTSYEYLGVSAEVVAELVDGSLDRTYQYGPGGLRLSMQTHDTAGGPQEASYYSYNPHADVVAITNEVGNTRARYGYTAYGNRIPTCSPESTPPTRATRMRNRTTSTGSTPCGWMPPPATTTWASGTTAQTRGGSCPGTCTTGRCPTWA